MGSVCIQSKSRVTIKYERPIDKKRDLSEEIISNNLSIKKKISLNDEKLIHSLIVSYHGQSALSFLQTIKVDEYGEYKFPDGTVYIGSMYKNQFQGYGKILFANEDFFEGAFLNGKAYGKGRYFYASGVLIETEFTKKGIQGMTRMYYPEKSPILLFEGNFEANSRNGLGIFHMRNGIRIQGCFENNELNTGKIFFENGDFYDGELKNFLMEGSGKIMYLNGDIFEGNFVKNQKHGIGKYHAINGNDYELEFFNDKIIEGSSENDVCSTFIKGYLDTILNNDLYQYECNKNNSFILTLIKSGVIV